MVSPPHSAQCTDPDVAEGLRHLQGQSSIISSKIKGGQSTLFHLKGAASFEGAVQQDNPTNQQLGLDKNPRPGWRTNGSKPQSGGHSLPETAEGLR